MNFYCSLRSLILLVLLLAAGNGKCVAQAVPDTSLNTVISDSLVERKEADLAERTEISTPVPSASVTTAPAKDAPFQPKPKKSALFAAIAPGTGQIYNRQYWKVPVVYGLAGVAIYFLVDNTKEYRRYRKAYVSRLTNPSYQDEFTDIYANYSNETVLANLKFQQDQFKKNLDLTYLLAGVGYALQVVDALAFAHLKNFDVSPNLSMRMKPVGTSTGGLGLGLVVNWR